MTHAPRIAITGAGAVSAFGDGVAALWAGLVAGASGVRPIDRFDTAPFRSRLGALVGEFDPKRHVPAGVLRRLDLASRFAVPAAAQALEQAGQSSRERIGVVLGTNSAGSVPVAEFLRAVSDGGPGAAPPILFPYTVANAPASQVALVLGLKGPNLTISQKEASSAGAVAVACGILAGGGAQAILAGGAEDLSMPVFEVLDRLGVLSRDRRTEGEGSEGSRPFDRARNGFVCGEGACFLHLETEASARARGATPLGFLEGVCVGRSPIVPHRYPRRTSPLASVVAGALSAASRSPDRVDAAFLSANSTPALDAAEASALHQVFDGSIPPVTSVRGAMGESGVAGVFSILAACLAMREGRLPGTAGLDDLDPALGLEASREARSLPQSCALVTGFASGGSAAAIVVAAP